MIWDDMGTQAAFWIFWTSLAKLRGPWNSHLEPQLFGWSIIHWYVGDSKFQNPFVFIDLPPGSLESVLNADVEWFWEKKDDAFQDKSLKSDERLPKPRWFVICLLFCLPFRHLFHEPFPCNFLGAWSGARVSSPVAKCHTGYGAHLATVCMSRLKIQETQMRKRMEGDALSLLVTLW